MATTFTKQSYTIPCSSRFRDRVLDLAGRRGANVADIARSIVLLVPPALLSAFPDPGGPAKGDREVVTVKTGPSKGRSWHRKPRLQVRLAPGYQPPGLRRALALALAMDQGDVSVELGGLDDAAKPMAVWTPESEDRRQALPPASAEDDEELARLRAIVSVLSFEPLAGGVRTREQAFHVLGLAPKSTPDIGVLRARFRMLAAIHHPDSGYGSHERMSQLNSAMELLRREP